MIFIDVFPKVILCNFGDQKLKISKIRYSHLVELPNLHLICALLQFSSKMDF